jgi:hypothetical protein
MFEHDKMTEIIGKVFITYDTPRERLQIKSMNYGILILNMCLVLLFEIERLPNVS